MPGDWKGVLLSVGLLLGIASQIAQADTATTTSAEISSAGLDLACMDYQVVGGCIWMTCTITGCEFDFSVRVRHNIPEAVVNAYPTLGRSPWPESQSVVSPTSFAQAGGASEEGGHTVREQALKFKNVEVFGSPATWAYHAAATAGDFPICRPLTWPMVPYFISTLDPNWRDPTVETPWTLANLWEGVSAGTSRFAGLFPRIGFVKQGHDYKAGLVCAKRAAHFVRQDGQPHVYTPLDTWYVGGGQGQWPPGQSTDYQWQQLVPSIMSCRHLPDINDTAHLTDPYRTRVNAVNGNAWQLWRPYSCCKRKGSTLIATF
jgi:integrating conjugative element protein (TIGR03756 family)